MKPLLVLFSLLCLAPRSLFASKPHIIYILADDVGFADVWSDAIPTPNLKRLASQGTRLNRAYAHSTCTPSRAALMTGRYACNTGLTFAMLPGSVDGLPPNMTTMPQMLRRHGYRAHMVGKWHLGAAQWSQTPVGRGFETHVGSLLWSMEYGTKELWELPWQHFAVDWIRAHENGSYEHRAEERHTTRALTDEAVQRIKLHASDSDTNDSPLFLYLAYTAAHAPLQADEDEATTAAADAARCAHLSHVWRRQFCALMQGLDRGVAAVVEAARRHLGDDLVVVFSSDNGGAPWFGGMNAPLRSGKTMPFEGGVRVPAFVVDFSSGGSYFGRSGGSDGWNGLVHLSDFLPTFARMAGASAEEVAAEAFDGVDVAPAMRAGDLSPRTDIVHEMYYHSLGEFMFDEDVVAYRRGRWKLIEGYGLRDSHWYVEPSNGRDRLHSSDATWLTRLSELTIRALEAFFGAGRFDTVRDLFLHVGVHAVMRGDSSRVLMLFDVEEDEEERRNLAPTRPDVVEELRAAAEAVRRRRPPQAKYWMTIDRDRHWRSTLQRGDCSHDKRIAPENCLFVHPFIDDNADMDEVRRSLVFGADATPFVRDLAIKAVKSLLLPLLVVVVALRLVCSRLCRTRSGRSKKKKE